MTVAVVAGGVGAARLLRGLVRVRPPAEVTAVVNVADDVELHGLHVSPDLDTVTYTLAGATDDQRGWGLAGETWHAMEALGRYPGAVTWFNLGDRDLATHLFRTHRLAEGAPLSAVTAEVAAAWGLGLAVLPATDDRLRTMVTLAGPGEGAAPGDHDQANGPGGGLVGGPGGEGGDSGGHGGPGEGGDLGREVGFQEYFVRLGHAVPITAVRFEGAEAARPAPGVVDAIASAARVVIAPSNPVVSIGPVLAVAGVRAAVEARRADVVAVSPIVAGAALKGPADRMLAELGHEPSVVGVARLYAPLAATLVIDEADAGRAAEVEAAGLRCVVAPTVMRDAATTDALARVVLSA